MRQRRRDAAAAERRVFRRRHGRPRFLGISHVGYDDAKSAAIEDSRDVIGAVVRHPHEARQSFRQRHQRDAAGGFDRQARMFEVDIDRIEAGTLGDADDLVAGDEPHRHRRCNLAPGELFLERIAQVEVFHRIPRCVPARVRSIARP